MSAHQGEADISLGLAEVGIFFVFLESFYMGVCIEHPLMHRHGRECVPSRWHLTAPSV